MGFQKIRHGQTIETTEHRWTRCTSHAKTLGNKQSAWRMTKMVTMDGEITIWHNMFRSMTYIISIWNHKNVPKQFELRRFWTYTMNIYESLHFELCSPMFPTLWHELLENYTNIEVDITTSLWTSRILWKAGLAVYDTSYRTGLNCAVQGCATVKQSFWRKEKSRNPFWSEKMRWFTVHEHLIYPNLLKLDLQFQDVKEIYGQTPRVPAVWRA